MARYFKNAKNYPLLLPRRPSGGSVPLQIGQFLEGDYYAQYTEGHGGLVEVTKEEAEAGILVWSATAHMEAAREKLSKLKQPLPPKLAVYMVGATPAEEVAPEATEPPVDDTPPASTADGGEGQDGATDAQEKAQDEVPVAAVEDEPPAGHATYAKAELWKMKKETLAEVVLEANEHGAAIDTSQAQKALIEALLDFYSKV